MEMEIGYCVRTRDAWVVFCPFCGQEHFHGTHKKGMDDEREIGMRMAHCGIGKSYILREVGVVPKSSVWGEAFKARNDESERSDT